MFSGGGGGADNNQQVVYGSRASVTLQQRQSLIIERRSTQLGLNEHYYHLQSGMFDATDEDSFFQTRLTRLLNTFTFQMKWASHWAVIQLLKHSPALLNIYFIGNYTIEEPEQSDGQPNENDNNNNNNNMSSSQSTHQSTNSSSNNPIGLTRSSPQMMIAIAIGYMVFCILGQYPIQALSSSFYELVCRKLHQNEPLEIGRLLHLQLQLTAIVSFLIMIILYFISPNIILFFLSHLEQSEMITVLAHQYICYLFPSLFLSGVYENFQSLLSALEIRQTPVSISLISSLIHLAICIPFEITDNFTIRIAAIAKGAADLTMAFALYKYTFRLEDIRDSMLVDFFIGKWYELVELLIDVSNQAFFYYIETFNYDIITICLCLCGTQTQQMQGHLIVTTLAFTNFYVSQGISSSIYQGVKNYIEKGLVNKARNSAILGVVVALIISLLEFFLLLNIQMFVAKLFISNDSKVLELFIQYFEVYIYLLFVDNALNSLLAILRSLKKQKLETVMHYVFFYAMGIPTSIFLAHSHDDTVIGIWLGYLFANSLFVLTILVYLLFCLEWDIEISRIQSIFNLERAAYV